MGLIKVCSYSASISKMFLPQDMPRSQGLILSGFVGSTPMGKIISPLTS